jgi:hypothetical protein
MDGIVLFVIILAGIAFFGALADTFGNDTRFESREGRAPTTFLR